MDKQEHGAGKESVSLNLARGYVDRDELTRMDSGALAAARSSDRARFILVSGETVAVASGTSHSKQNDEGGELSLLKLDRSAASTWGSYGAVYLGKNGTTPYFACDVADIDDQFDMRSIRFWAHEFDGLDTTLAVSAVALLQWQHRDRFCPECGEPLELRFTGWEKICPQGHFVYPRMDPAVIMAIHDSQDRLLLGRNAAWGPGRYSVLAGYVETGESLEAAVRREVFEETRIAVGALAYFGSQPWPFPRSLMLAFQGWTDDGEADIAVDGKEMAHAHFFEREEFVEALRSKEIQTPTPTSVARALIQDWLGQPLDDIVRG